MSTMVGKIRVAQDTQIRVVGTTTNNGAAQNKGTCTDLLLVIGANSDGANAISGAVAALTLQGSNSTAFTTPTTITVDKGTMPSFTAAGTGSVHAAQLQFQYYRLNAATTGAGTVDVSATWLFMPVEDSFDAAAQ